MDLFGIKRRKKRKEIKDALNRNYFLLAWISKKLTEADLKGNESEAEELRKGYCRALEVIESQEKFLYGGGAK